jgi:hypothetical protein
VRRRAGSRDQATEPRLRLADGEVAVRLTGAADRIRPDLVHVEREADLLQPRHNGVDGLDRNTRDDEVLLARDPDVAAERLRELGDGDQVVARDETEADGDADVRKSLLLLRVHAHVVRRLHIDRRQLEILERASELRFDALADPLRADVVDHELEPRLYA